MSALSLKSADTDTALPALIHQAASQIAPQWPLDQLIAVNPWWPKRQQPFNTVCAEQQLLEPIRDCADQVVLVHMGTPSLQDIVDRDESRLS